MNPLNQKFLSCLLILMFYVPVSGQIIFREGYIVKDDGTFITGLIEYKNSKIIPEKCTFKRFEIAEPIEFSKDQITEFGYLNGNRYVLRRYEGREMFFELLVSGKINLYKNGDGTYLEKGNSKLIKLTGGDITLYESGTKIVLNGAEELLGHFTEGKVNPIDKETVSSENLLIDKVIEYNKVSGTPYLTSNREFDDSRLIKKALVTGFNRNRFGVLTGTDMLMCFGPDEKISAVAVTDRSGWVAGFNYERIISRVNDRLNLGFEFLLIQQELRQFYLVTTRFSVRHFEYFNLKDIKPSAYLLYTFPKAKFEPFLSAGLSFRTNLYGEYYKIIQFENEGVITSEAVYGRDFKPLRINLVVSGGVKYKLTQKIKVNINIRAEGGLEGFTANASRLTHNYGNVGILAGIQF